MPEGLTDLVMHQSRAENTAQLLNLLAGENTVKSLALFLAMPETYRLVESFGVNAAGAVEIPRDGDPLRWLQENAQNALDDEACLVPIGRDGRDEGCLCLIVGGEAGADFIASAAFKAFAAYELEGIVEARRRMEIEALAEANREMFRALFDRLPHPAVVVRRDSGLIEHANPAFEQMAGMPIAEIIGKSLWEFPGMHAEGLQNAVGRAAGTRQEVFIRLTGGHRSAQPSPESSLVGIGAAIVDPDTLCVFIRDFSETLDIRSRLLAAEKRGAIHNVLRRIAHDINNALAAISGFAQLLAKNQQPPDDAKGQAQRILGQAERCKNTVQELAAIARQPLHADVRINVNDLVRSAVQVHDISAQSLGIAVTAELGEGLPSVRGDPLDVQCAIDEAVANALDAFHEANKTGTVTLRTRSEDQGIVIEVEDDAGGAREPGKVFDSFYTTGQLPRHIGLGLTLVKAVAEDHGGAATFENTGRGARLRIVLPPHG